MHMHVCIRAGLCKIERIELNELFVTRFIAPSAFLYRKILLYTRSISQSMAYMTCIKPQQFLLLITFLIMKKNNKEDDVI